mgnify:CR=1 FL=1
MPTNKPCCPECRAIITVWADIDAKATWSISQTGSLYKQEITNSFQSDARAGIECTECDWSVYAGSSGSDQFEEIMSTALARQEAISRFAAKVS